MKGEAHGEESYENSEDGAGEHVGRVVLVVRNAREAAVEGAGDGDRLQRESQGAQPVDRQARLKVELQDSIDMHTYNMLNKSCTT